MSMGENHLTEVTEDDAEKYRVKVQEHFDAAESGADGR
jgi:hypothetical protein